MLEFLNENLVLNNLFYIKKEKAELEEYLVINDKASTLFKMIKFKGGIVSIEVFIEILVTEKEEMFSKIKQILISNTCVWQVFFHANNDSAVHYIDAILEFVEEINSELSYDGYIVEVKSNGVKVINKKFI